MSFGRFIKQNFALCVGIALPVVLVLVFLAVSIIPKTLAAPPLYKIAYTVTDYGSGRQPGNIQADLQAKNGKIILSMTKSKNDVYNREKLMIYDAASNSSREISYALPAGLRGSAEEEELAEAKGMALSPDKRAPDGYVFDDASSSSGSLATELFAGGRRSSPRMVKGAVAYKIPEDLGYNSIRFLGWVITEKAE